MTGEIRDLGPRAANHPGLEQVGPTRAVRSRDGGGRIVQTRSAALDVSDHLAQPQSIMRFSSYYDNTVP